MSICAIRAPGANRPAPPKPKIQLNRPPIIRIASALLSAEERALFMKQRWSSGIVPRAIGEVTYGIPRSASWASAAPAPAHAAPLPIRSSGRSAFASSAAIRSIAAGSACGTAISGARVRSGARSAATRRDTQWPGKSRYTAPGRPAAALPSARCNSSGIRSVLSTSSVHLQPGRANARWSASWKPPSPRVGP